MRENWCIESWVTVSWSLVCHVLESKKILLKSMKIQNIQICSEMCKFEYLVQWLKYVLLTIRYLHNAHRMDAYRAHHVCLSICPSVCLSGRIFIKSGTDAVVIKSQTLKNTVVKELERSSKETLLAQFKLLDVLHSLASANNTLWVRPYPCVCLSRLF
jgi:hypothetical protein